MWQEAGPEGRVRENGRMHTRVRRRPLLFLLAPRTLSASSSALRWPAAVMRADAKDFSVDLAGTGWISEVAPPIPPSFLSCICLSHALAAPLMSVLSRGPPFHTAALTIVSITSNYLAVFPLLTLSPAFISALEL